MRTKTFIAFLSLGLAAIAAIRSSAQIGEGGENIILGRPTDDSIVVHVLAETGTDVFVEYGEASGRYGNRTDVTESSLDGTAEVVLKDLDANTAYFYRIHYRAVDDLESHVGEEHSFWTQRSKGSTFSFGVQGDSHPERLRQMYSPDLYARTMERVAGDRPDLYFMLGDDFSISNQLPNYFQGDRSTLTQNFVDDIYINQRRFLGIMANSTALFPVNGNHEEARRSLLGTPLHDASIFAGRARNRYFPVPTPDDFYTGNPEPVDGIGLLGDYFAFEWGDALFISLDPYWHSPRVTEPIGGMGTGSASLGQQPSANVGGMGVGMGMGQGIKPWAEIADDWAALTRPTGNLWHSTIGDVQYEWLKRALEESDARYKFVFTHHVLGVGRGGIERATRYEWGGYTDEGVWEFNKERPHWELPIHQLMVKHDVTIFFQAHDHIFVRQELDGIIYQSVPNPADDTYTARNRNAYLSGDALDNSGYLNVLVSPEQVKVDYIRSYLPEHELGGRKHGEIAYSYLVD